MPSDDMIAKIKALRAKADDAASTEAEAMACINQAMKLSAKHGVTLDDLKDHADEIAMDERDLRTTGRYPHEVDSMLGQAISRYTGTKVWYKIDEDKVKHLTYFGIDSDVELALYLRENFKSAIEAVWKIHCRYLDADANFAVERRSLVFGIVHALTERLDFVQREYMETNSDSKALVVKKNDLVQSAFDAKGLALRKGRAKARKIGLNGDTYASGLASGKHMDIGRGTSKGGPLRLT